MIRLYQEVGNCSKKKCSKELDKVSNDKKLKLEREKLFKTRDLDEKEKILTNVYSNKNQVNLDLCKYKHCKKVNKTLQDHKLKVMKDEIKLYNIKFPEKYKKKI